MINRQMYLVSDFSKLEKKPMRDGYGEALVELAGKESRVVVLCADLRESLKLDEFAKKFPERFIETGIAEQNMMGVAAGMAISGKVPFVNSYAVFNPGRNWDQLRVSVCLTNENVKMIGGHAGFGNGFDGANQQAFEDIALTRVLPNMKVIVPADYEQIKKAVSEMVHIAGSVYLRMTKPARSVVTTHMTPFEFGKVQVFREGSEVTVFACGEMVAQALFAAEELVGEVDVEVVNVHTIKPIDVEGVVRSAKKTGRVVTAEEHSVIGGLGSTLAEVLGEHCPVMMKRVGMQDRFGESGEPEELLKKYGMSKEAIVGAVREIIRYSGE